MGQNTLSIFYLVIGILAAIGLLFSMKVFFTFLKKILSSEKNEDKD